jgi:hypothetical protein
VIGEANHWEEKSRTIIRLCNDYNLCVPDNILVRLFLDFKEAFGDKYQSLITKNSYRKNPKIQQIINDIIQDYQFKVLQDIDSQKSKVHKIKACICW